VEETRQHAVVNGDEDEKGLRARRRLIGFGFHLVGYFVVMAGLFLVSFSEKGDLSGLVIPMVGWGSVLALHAAFVMGLFGVFSGRKN
jgi:hypothetical protein